MTVLSSIQDHRIDSTKTACSIPLSENQEKLLHIWDLHDQKITEGQRLCLWIDARLNQIDPSLVGKKRRGSSLHCLKNRIRYCSEIQSLQDRKFRAIRSIEQSFKECLRIEREFNELDSVKSSSNMRELVSFFEEMPVFKKNPSLVASFEKSITLPQDVQVALASPDTLEIIFPERTKMQLDMNSKISEEECRTLDPANPMIGSGKDILLSSLNQVGSIDKSWIETIKERKPAFGPKMVIRREGNAIEFLEGVSKLRKIEILPSGVGFQILWFWKKMDWKLEDFFFLLTKFKVIPPEHKPR